MRFQVILDIRHAGGASYGTTDDVIEADSPNAAERSAIEQWTALRPTSTFHALLTIELADESSATLELPEPFPGYDANVASGAPADGDFSVEMTDRVTVSQDITSCGRTVARCSSCDASIDRDPAESVSDWFARVGEFTSEHTHQAAPNAAYCAEHEAGECFDGCPNAYTSVDREHRFAEGDLIAHVSAPHEAAVVSALTWRVVDSVAYPTYTLSDRAPLTMDEVVEDVLDDADLVPFNSLACAACHRVHDSAVSCEHVLPRCR